jgi:hypothetical protein
MDVSTKQIKNIIEATDAAYFNQLTKDAVRLDFAPSKEAIETAHRLYFPMRFSPGRRQPTSHQLAAIHLRYAERMLHQYAKGHMPCVEIGPNPSGMMSIGANQPKVHGCCLFSGRDQVRYTTAAASQKVRGCRDRTYAAQTNLLASGIKTDKFCVQGFGKCDFQAPFGIANHSLYDISLQELAAGMHNHNMSKIIAYMHLTPAALLKDEHVDKTLQVRHKIYFDGKKVKTKRILVGFPNDPSWAYDHDYNIFMSYLVRHGLETPYGFNLLIERVVNFGSQFCIHITRTSLPVKITAYIPSAFMNAIGVPDFLHLASVGFNPIHKMKTIVTDKLKVQRLYHYLLARDEKQADLRAAFSYARAELRKVTLGDQVIDHQWDIESEDFNKVVIGVYLMARLTMLRNNATIDEVKKQIEKLAGKRSWFARLFPGLHDVMKEVQATLHDLFGTKYEVSKLLSGVGDNPMQHVAFEHYIEQITSEEFCVEGDVEEVNFQPIVHYDETPYGPMPPMEERPIPSSENCRHHDAVPLELKIDHSDLHDKFLRELETGLSKTELKSMQTVLQGALTAASGLGVVPFEPSKFQGVFGVPGGCKTAQAFLKYIPSMINADDNFLYVVPSTNLKSGLESRVAPPNRIVTMHVAMDLLYRGRVMPALIVVDECFRLPLPLLAFYTHFAPVLLIGDPNQIAHIDRESIWLDSPQLKDVYLSIEHDFLLQSSRMPTDICQLPLIASLYPGISTTSKKGTGDEGALGPSLSYVHGGFTRDNVQVLTLTQDAKASYANQGAITVDEAQGGTFSSVILHVGNSPGERWLLQNSVPHIVVGLTRHTNLLFVREEIPGALGNAMRVHMGGHVEFDVLLDETNVPLPKFDKPQQPNYSTTNLNKVNVAYVSAEINPTAVDDVLAAIYPGVTDIQEYQSVESTNFPFHHGGKAVIKIDELGNDALLDSKSSQIHRFPAAQRVKITNAKGTGMAIRTLLDRYTKKTKNMRDEAAVTEAVMIHGILSEYIDFQVTETDKAEVLAEALDKFQSRGHDIKHLKDLDCWTDQGATIVTFNTKTQQKFGAKDPLTTDKAGQGIAAWEKSLNFKMVVWTRLLERICLRAQGGLIFASNRSDTEMLELLDCIAVEDDYEYLEGDWTEFDSAQNNLEHHLLMQNLKAIGCPDILRENFLSMMKKRYVQAKFGSVIVENKKDSGRVDTLIGNSLFNIGILLTCVNRRDLKYILYKGDDSLLVGKTVKPNYSRLKLLSGSCNYQLKLAVSKSAEFTSFILNANGAALNIPRIAAKVLTRNYTPEKYQEYIIAVRDLIKTSNDVEAAQRMCQVNAAHFRINVQDIDICLSFMHNFSRGRYPIGKLTVFDSRIKTEGL